MSGAALTGMPAGAQTAKKIAELRAEASVSFLAKEYSKAVDAYEKAIKLLPDSAADKADLFSNKAACYYQQKRCAPPPRARAPPPPHQRGPRR
jgi:tetratricopeptide (TPR) repeat protein